MSRWESTSLLRTRPRVEPRREGGQSTTTSEHIAFPGSCEDLHLVTVDTRLDGRQRSQILGTEWVAVQSEAGPVARAVEPAGRPVEAKGAAHVGAHRRDRLDARPAIDQ